MNNPITTTSITLLLAVSSLSAATHYVSLESSNPTPPYTNWVTAATNIQDAVDVAGAGDTVVVNDGVYAVGSRQVVRFRNNSRVAITNAVCLQSVNGPQSTAIDGGGTNMCTYLSTGASVTGFTLTNGFNGNGGGACCSSASAYLTNCTVVGNRAGTGGAGVYGGTLYNCLLAGNSCAGQGGGAESNTLYNCKLSGNSGCGAYGCTLYNCALAGNSVCGAFGCTLYNCTVTGNSSTYDYSFAIAGGVTQSTLYNCIVYFNTGPTAANYDSLSTLNYCCTTPLPANGTGNIGLDPQLASTSHLSADSPCLGAASAAYASGTDIDDELWGNPPSIGCDEYHAGTITEPLSVRFAASYTNMAAGQLVRMTAIIEGRTTESARDFGDGDLALNQPYATHSWTQPGDYRLSLTAFNESNPGGVSAAVSVHVAAGVLYVAATGSHPQPPYTSWATAATNIQQAVDAARAGTVVVVTNGVYPGGVRVTNPLTIRSVNGPQFTVIDGGRTNRCITLSDGASLSGFTLRNGSTSGDGGGVWCPSTNGFVVVTNCTLTGNSAGRGGGQPASSSNMRFAFTTAL